MLIHGQQLMVTAEWRVASFCVHGGYGSTFHGTFGDDEQSESAHYGDFRKALINLMCVHSPEAGSNVFDNDAGDQEVA